MRILAIDTSCDESCAAVVDTTAGKLLADVVHSHVDVLRKYGGVVPELASREHLRGLPLAVAQALEQAGLELTGIDHFAVTNRPGLIGALLVGLAYTKGLAFSVGKPFSALNHVEAHLYSPWLAAFDGKSPPSFPWVALVVSGGHTELYYVEEIGKYRHLGGTLDDAAGEAFDKSGKLLGLPYPAGPVIDRLSRGVAPDERKRFRFPKAKMDGYDFSFSGLKTAVANQVAKLGTLDGATRAVVAACTQEAILDALVEKAAAARRDVGGTLVVTGGVACNSRLREKLPDAYFPLPRHCSDNAAMVANLAALLAKAGKLDPAPLSEVAYPQLN